MRCNNFESTVIGDEPIGCEQRRRAVVPSSSSCEGQDSIELDPVFGELDHSDVDVGTRRHKVAWSDGKRLSIEASAARLHSEHPDTSRDLLETHVFGHLGGCAPESYTDEQIEEFGQLMEPWLDDHARKRWPRGK